MNWNWEGEKINHDYCLFTVCCSVASSVVDDDYDDEPSSGTRRKSWGEKASEREIWLLILFNILFCELYILLFFLCSTSAATFLLLSSSHIYCCFLILRLFYLSASIRLNLPLLREICNSPLARTYERCWCAQPLLSAIAVLRCYEPLHFSSFSSYSFNILINCIRAAAQTIYSFISYYIFFRSIRCYFRLGALCIFGFNEFFVAKCAHLRWTVPARVFCPRWAFGAPTPPAPSSSSVVARHFGHACITILSHHLTFQTIRLIERYIRVISFN